MRGGGGGGGEDVCVCGSCAACVCKRNSQRKACATLRVLGFVSLCNRKRAQRQGRSCNRVTGQKANPANRGNRLSKTITCARPHSKRVDSASLAQVFLPRCNASHHVHHCVLFLLPTTHSQPAPPVSRPNRIKSSTFRAQPISCCALHTPGSACTPHTMRASSLAVVATLAVVAAQRPGPPAFVRVLSRLARAPRCAVHSKGAAIPPSHPPPPTAAHVYAACHPRPVLGGRAQPGVRPEPDRKRYRVERRRQQ